jgi:hypothetical protein
MVSRLILVLNYVTEATETHDQLLSVINTTQSKIVITYVRSKWNVAQSGLIAWSHYKEPVTFVQF